MWSAILVGLAAAAAGATGILVLRAQLRRTPLLQSLVRGEVGVDELPPALQKRLASPRHRASVANALRKAAKDASKRPRRKTLPNPPMTHHMPENIRDRIRAVADVVADPATSARAIAMAELLVGEGTSPLYGESEPELLAALAAIHDAR